MPSTSSYQPGDLVYSSVDLHNEEEGGIPDAAPGELLVPAGTRGVVVNAGHAEADPDIDIYLVRFEGTDDELGPPVGCLDHELTREEALPALAAVAAEP